MNEIHPLNSDSSEPKQDIENNNNLSNLQPKNPYLKEFYSNDSLNIEKIVGDSWIKLEKLSDNEGYSKYKITKKDDVVTEWSNNITDLFKICLHFKNLSIIFNELDRVKDFILHMTQKCKQLYDNTIYQRNKLENLINFDIHLSEQVSNNENFLYKKLISFAQLRVQTYYQKLNGEISDYLEENKELYDQINGENEDFKEYLNKLAEIKEFITLIFEKIETIFPQSTKKSIEIIDEVSQIMDRLEEFMSLSERNLKFFIESLGDLQRIEQFIPFVEELMVIEFKLLYNEEYSKELETRIKDIHSDIIDYIDVFTNQTDEVIKDLEDQTDKEKEKLERKKAETRQKNKDDIEKQDSSCLNCISEICGCLNSACIFFCEKLFPPNHVRFQNQSLRIQKYKADMRTFFSNLNVDFNNPYFFSNAFQNLLSLRQCMSFENGESLNENVNEIQMIIKVENVVDLGMHYLNIVNYYPPKYDSQYIIEIEPLVNAYNTWLDYVVYARYLQFLTDEKHVRSQKLFDPSVLREEYMKIKENFVKSSFISFSHSKLLFDFYLHTSFDMFEINFKNFKKLLKKYLKKTSFFNTNTRCKSSYYNTEMTGKQIKYKIKKNLEKKKIQKNNFIFVSFNDIIEIVKSKKFWGAMNDCSKLITIQFCEGINEKKKEIKPQKKLILTDFNLDLKLSNLVKEIVDLIEISKPKI